MCISQALPSVVGTGAGEGLTGAETKLTLRKGSSVADETSVSINQGTTLKLDNYLDNNDNHLKNL